MTYWLDLFTGVTWNEFRNAGSKVTGFRETRWKTIQRIKEGDIFLCYLTGVSRFVGLLEVTGKPFQDDSPIWKDMVFPCRLPVKPLLELDPEYGVSVHDLRDRLSCFCCFLKPVSLPPQPVVEFVYKRLRQYDHI